MILNPGFIKNIVAWPFATAFFLTFIAVPAVISLANYLYLVDNPKVRPHAAHTEERVIPRAGGLAILFGLLAAIFLFIPFSKQMVGIVSGAVVLVIIGLIDDYRDTNPYVRLFGANLIAALLAVGAGAGIPYITNPFGGVIHLDTLRITVNFLGQHSFLPLADLASVVWIVWVMNMVGWSGGVDGQLPGFVGIAAFFIGILSLGQIGVDNFPYWTVAALSFITAGAYFGFLPWNFYPQKIMPGYGGKALAGFLLAVISVLSVTKIGTAILVLGVPMIDAVYVMIGRILKHQSPVWDSRTHLHHKLLDIGWSKRRVALFYWVVSAILGAAALILNGRQKFFAFVFLAVTFLMVVLWLSLYSHWRAPSGFGNGSKT